MVRRVITLFLILASMWCLAEEARLVREVVVTAVRSAPPEYIDYRAWAQTAATLDDQELLNLLFEEYRNNFFNNRHPSLDKLRELEQTFPSCDHLLNLLAWNRYRMGVELEYALTLANRIQDHTESTYDTLGVLKLKCGYPADSLQIFLDLLPYMRIELPPNSNKQIPTQHKLINYIATIIVYDHAADAFYKNGHLREAAKLWSEAHLLIQKIQQTFDFNVTTFPIYDFNYSRFQQKFKAIRTLLKTQRATSET